LVFSTQRLTVIISERLRPEQAQIWVGGRIVVVGPGPRAAERAEYALRTWRLCAQATALEAEAAGREKASTLSS
jgi:hypothetical protein